MENYALLRMVYVYFYLSTVRSSVENVNRSHALNKMGLHKLGLVFMVKRKCLQIRRSRDMQVRMGSMVNCCQGMDAGGWC